MTRFLVASAQFVFVFVLIFILWLHLLDEADHSTVSVHVKLSLWCCIISYVVDLSVLGETVCRWTSVRR